MEICHENSFMAFEIFENKQPYKPRIIHLGGIKHMILF